jgi:hypothetical protein
VGRFARFPHRRLGASEGTVAQVRTLVSARAVNSRSDTFVQWLAALIFALISRPGACCPRIGNCT